MADTKDMVDVDVIELDNWERVEVDQIIRKRLETLIQMKIKERGLFQTFPQSTVSCFSMMGIIIGLGY